MSLTTYTPAQIEAKLADIKRNFNYGNVTQYTGGTFETVAAATAFWTSENAASRTPIDSQEIYIKSLLQIYKWNGTLVDKCEFSRVILKKAESITEDNEDVATAGQVFAEIEAEVVARDLAIAEETGARELADENLEKQVANKVEGVPKKNLYNKATAKDGFYLSNTNGEVEGAAFSISDFIKVTPAQQYVSTEGLRFTTYFDSNFAYVAGGSSTTISTFTPPNGVAYVKVTIEGLAKKDTLQIEVGATSTAYEAYTLIVDETKIPTTITRNTQLTTFALKSEIAKKANLIPKKNLFDKNATKKTFVVDEESQIDTFGDQILANCLTTGFNFSTWKLKYNVFGISLSPPIPITPEIGNIKSNQSPTTSTAVLYFNENNRIIKTERTDVLATWYEEATNGTLTYVRFSYSSGNEATFQVEVGTTSTDYEAYTLIIDEKEFVPTGKVLANNTKALSGGEAFKAISNKVDGVVGINLFNKDLPKVQFISGQLQQTDVYEEQILVNANTTGFDYASWQLAYTAFGISLSPKIYLTDENPTAKLNEAITTQTAVLYFNIHNRIIKKVTTTNLADKTILSVGELSNGAFSYCRFTYTKDTENVVQIQFGTTSTDYEPYTIKGDIAEINKQLYDTTTEVILPSKLFFIKDYPAHIYKENIVRKNLKDAITLTTSLGVGYSRLVKFTFTSAVTNQNLTLSTTRNLRVVKSKLLTYDVINKTVNSGKILNIIHVGDSFTDIGATVQNLREKLIADGVTVNQLGLGGSSTIGKVEGISGGNIGNTFLNSSLGVAKIVDATVTVSPATGFRQLSGVSYFGAVYDDDNGNRWTIRGYANGKLLVSKMGAVLADFTTFPASGNLTKVAGQDSFEGDAVIAYTNPVNAYFNPFINGSTGLLDITNYINTFGFSTLWNTVGAKNIISIQFTWNDLPETASEATIMAVVNQFIEAVDHIHTAYPDVKVILSIEPFGAINYAGRNFDLKKKVVLRFAELLIETFEAVAYNSFVQIAPSYAYVDLINGYSLVSANPNPRYTNETEVQAGDGVHPNSTKGMLDMADCQYPIIHKFLV